MPEHLIDLWHLLEEKVIEVRTVDVYMAHCASLELRRLVMERGGAGRARIHSRECVAFQAKQVDLAPLQQPRIR